MKARDAYSFLIDAPTIFSEAVEDVGQLAGIDVVKIQKSLHYSADGDELTPTYVRRIGGAPLILERFPIFFFDRP